LSIRFDRGDEYDEDDEDEMRMRMGIPIVVCCGLLMLLLLANVTTAQEDLCDDIDKDSTFYFVNTTLLDTDTAEVRLRNTPSI